MALHHLALELVKDGEGATKLVAFEVTGAKSDDEAKKAAKMISNSLLVKTALFGQDPNWGRLAMAVGASGITCDETKLIIKIGSVELYKEGVNLMSPETEAKAAKVMQADEFRVTCHIGLGIGSYTAYGCDLGYEYVKINADYRT
jgi:glutamate N-acetyltransferase/amino-acid N-acetyltransferase